MLESMFGPLEPVKEETLQPEVPPVGLPEDDIFTEAGTDYKCDTSRRKKKKTLLKPEPLPTPPEPLSEVPLRVELGLRWIGEGDG